MSKKSKGIALLSADQYLWIGPQAWTHFERGNTRIRLATVTNERITTLIQEDPAYWTEKFKKIAVKPLKEAAE